MLVSPTVLVSMAAWPVVGACPVPATMTTMRRSAPGPTVPSTLPFLVRRGRELGAVIAVRQLRAALPTATSASVAPEPVAPAISAIARPTATRLIQTAGLVITGVSAGFVLILPATGPRSEMIVIARASTVAVPVAIQGMIFLVAMMSVTVTLHRHLEILLFIRADKPSKTEAATTQWCAPLGQ